tara:strand:+ start:313 stop:450 length:138 start_codon:yes stop_codon:yes gene_type:complete
MEMKDAMDEIFNLCQEALIWEGMCENAMFNYKLLTEIELLAMKFE